jgi:hypothetical protein
MWITSFPVCYSQNMIKKISNFVILIVVVTVIFGSIYGVGQQVLRLSANDPQVQIAEDLAVRLNTGKPATVPSLDENVDIRTSLAPFFIIFDASGKPISGTGTLDGKLPTPPKGVLDYAAEHGNNRITWQPDKNIRIAAVVQKSNSGTILAGRSLREIEEREDKISLIALAGWLASILFMCLYGVIHFKQQKA